MGARVAILALLLGTALAAQQPPAQFRAETRVVEIDISAFGRNGQAVDQLHRSDFTVYVDGHVQPYSIFSFNSGTETEPSIPHPPTPQSVYSNRGATSRTEAERSAVILIDTFNGWFENFANARQAVLGALDKLPADERIALYAIDRYQGLQQLADFTTDRLRLRAVLAHYTPRGTCPAPPGMEGAGDGERFDDAAAPPAPGTQTSTGADATPYENAIMISPCQDQGPQKTVLVEGAESVRLALQALASSLQSVPGRKSVFWITQGFPPYLLQSTFNSTVSCAGCDAAVKAWGDTFKKLNDANVAVNTLDANGLGGPPRLWGTGGVLSMQKVAGTTGGQTFYNNADLAAALARGIVEARSSYTLGFYLQKLDGKYHSVKVVVDRPSITLSYRTGYYAESDAARAAANKTIDLRTALANPAGENGVGITAWTKPEGITLELTLNLDPATLTVRQQGNSWNGQVDELIVERGADGRQLGRESDVKRFAMTPSVRQEVARDGLSLKRSLRLVPGAASVEIVVRDHDSGRIGSLTVPLPPAPAPANPAGK